LEAGDQYELGRVGGMCRKQMYLLAGYESVETQRQWRDNAGEGKDRLEKETGLEVPISIHVCRI
jgi:hypothetical protein